MDWKKNYGHLVKFLDNGRNQLFGRFYSPIQLVLTFAIYFSVTGKEIGLLQIGLFSITLMVVMVVSGYFYSKWGLFSSELSSRNLDTPEVMENLYKTRETLEIVKRIEEKIGDKHG